MDSGGILPGALDTKCAQFAGQGKLPRVLYLVPTGQNPTGCTLSAERRRQIYAVCRKYDIVIIEDDPYFFLQMPKYDPKEPDHDNQNETRLCELPPSFLSIDTDGRVIRLDSFSKIIAPGLRVGWMTGHPEIMAKVGTLCLLTSWSVSGPTQASLVALLKHWGEEVFELHIAYLQRFYTRCAP